MPGSLRRPGFDPARVVQVRIDADPAAGTFRFGSGYIVARGLVITAGHVLTLGPELAPIPGARCEVRTGPGTWNAGKVVWASGGDRDVAFVRAPDVGRDATAVRWGMLMGTHRLEWRAVGFPVASLDDSGRNAEEVWGEVSPVTQAESRRLGLTIASREARPVGLDKSGWAGLSGASVFCDDVLIGVITSDSGGYDRSLIATRVDGLTHDSALTAVLGGSPELEPVTAGLGTDIRRCRRRRRFDGILEREAECFGGRSAALGALRAFVSTPSDRGLVVEAPAGYGKTALLANLIGSHDFKHAYHFFVPDDMEMLAEHGFLASLVEQLAALAGAESDTRFDDVAWLQGRASELAESLAADEHVLVIDGLDEAPWDAAEYIRRLNASGLRTLVSERWTGAPTALRGRNFGSYRLPGLDRSEIAQVLEAGGVSAAAGLIDDIERIAPGTVAEFGGADPFMVRFIADDLAAGHGDTLRLRESPPGIEAYIDGWFDRILKSATAHPASLWVVRLLASAKGPLGATDLEELVPVFPDQVLRPTLREIVAPVRRHLIEDRSGYRLAHPRLADLVRRRSDAASDERRLIEYCRHWQDHHSPYAVGYLIRHLLDVEDEEAIWQLLANADSEGSNPWYLAHLDAAGEPPVAGGERPGWLQWYLADLDAVVRHANDLRAANEPLAATVRLRVAVVRSTFASIARRVPDGLLNLLAAGDIRRASTAMTLAQLRSTAEDRVTALVTVASAAVDPVARRAAVREALQAIEESSPHERARHLAGLVPALTPADAAEAVVLLGSLGDDSGLVAALALAPRMANDKRDDFLTMVRASISMLNDPVSRERWLAQMPGGSGESTADAFTAAYHMLNPKMPASNKTLIEAGLALVGPHPRIASMVLDLITREQAKDQPWLLARLADTGPEDVIISCVNALLELESSNERGSALAMAVGRLDADNTRALLQGIEWDFDELSLVVPGLREPQRGEAAAAVLAHVSQFAIEPATVEIIANVAGRVGLYLDEPQQTQAIQLLEQCVTIAPRVPPNEEIARLALALVRITGPDGQTVIPTWRAGISRAEVLALLGSVDQTRREVHVDAALRATLAVGDASPAAQLLADLGAQSTGEVQERLTRAALDAALAIEWPATLAMTLCKIIPTLPEDYRPEVRGALQRLRDAPERAKEVDLMLLGQERPLSATFTEALTEAVGWLEEDMMETIMSSVAADLPDAAVEGIVASLSDRFQAKEHDTALPVYTALAELARAGRLSLRQAERATGGAFQVSLISALLPTLEPGERDELARRTLEAVGTHASVPERIDALGMLRSAVSNTELANVFTPKLEEDLASLDLEALPPGELAKVAPFVPGPARTLVWRNLFDRRVEMDPFDWVDSCTSLAIHAPTALLPEMLTSIAPASPGRRAPAAAALSAEIATRGDDAMASSAWTFMLEMAERDLRPEFFEQLRGSLPLARRILGDDMTSAVADTVQCIQIGFP